MVRSKPPKDAQVAAPVDAKPSQRKRRRTSADVELVLAVYELVQQQADELKRTFTLTITFHPGKMMPTITIEEVPDKSTDAEEEHVSPPWTK